MIKLIKVTESNRMMVKRLQQFYLHDMASYSGAKCVDGVFINNDLEQYMTDEKLHAFLIEFNTQTIGFVFINEAPYAPEGHDYFISDLFIMNPYRRQGLGSEAFKCVLEAYPGYYGILEVKENRSAVQFWRMALKRARQREVEMLVDNVPSYLMSFESKEVL